MKGQKNKTIKDADKSPFSGPLKRFPGVALFNTDSKSVDETILKTIYK